MVTFQSPESLSAELSEGIGNQDLYFEAIPAHLRLRMPVCGLASYALATALRASGHEISIFKTSSHFEPNHTHTHVFSVLHDQSGETIIDPTYSSLLNFAGLSAEGVMLDAPDYFPESTIETFRPESRAVIAAQLSVSALRSLKHAAQRTDPYARKPAFSGMALTRIKSLYSEVWNPENWEQYRPERDIRYHGLDVAAYISANSLRIIA